MSRNTRLAFGLAILALVTAALSPTGSAFAQAEGGAGFDPYRMYAHLMVDGGSSEAGEISSTPCLQIHQAIDDYNAAEPWVVRPPDVDPEITFWKLFHTEVGPASTDVLNAWLISEGRTTYTPSETRTCTFLHEDGWLAASASVVEWVDDDFGGLIIITSEGETTCAIGEVLLASASYRYVWFESYQGWQYWYGSAWVEFPAPGTLVSGEINFECVEIYDPVTAFDEVVEAVPTTQVNLNPSIKGLTGLDTWLWYDFSAAAASEIGPITATINSRGMTWILDSYAWVDKVMWDIDCTSNCTLREFAADFSDAGYEYVLDFPDSALSPAAVYDGGAGIDGEAAFEHIYDDIGDFTVSTATVWRGYWQQSNTYDGVGPPHLHAPIVVANEWSLPVVSVRSELRNRDP